MNAKKILSLLLVLVMVFSMAACSGSTSGPGTSSSSGNNNPISSGENPGGTEDNDVPEVMVDTITMSTAPWYRGEMNVYTSATSGEVADKDPNTLRIGSGNQIISVDPLQSQDELPWSHNVYEPLIWRNTETGEGEPCLATEWYYDDEGSFHVTLRENVKFHDGTTLDAQDVIYTLKRNADNSSSNINAACSLIDFDNIVVEDDLHLVIPFTAPSGSFEAALMTGFAGIMSSEFMAEHGEDYDFFEADAGTGPYTVIETVSGLSQKFQRFADYWGDAPYFEYVECVLYKDYTVAVIDYTNGDLDVLQSINNYDAAMRFFTGEIGSTVCYQLPVNRGTILYMNNNVGPCTDENVRMAIAHAIDYDELVYGAYQGNELGKRATSVILDGSLYTISQEYEYDPELALQYLEAAGYGNGSTLKLTLETSDNAVNQSICEILQYYLGEIGIDVECIFEKSAAMTTALNSTDYTYDMIVYPLQYRSGHPSESLSGRDAYGKEAGTFASIKGINSEELHNLMVEGASCLDDAVAADVYAQIQQLFYDNAWAIPLTITKSICFVRDYLTADGNPFTNGYGNQWSAFRAK